MSRQSWWRHWLNGPLANISHYGLSQVDKYLILLGEDRAAVQGGLVWLETDYSTRKGYCYRKYLWEG